MRVTIITAVILLLFVSCDSKKRTNNVSPIDTNKISTNETTPVICDTFRLDIPIIRDYKKVLSVWLEDSSTDWFLKYRRSAWGDAIAWVIKNTPIDSNAILKCESKTRKNVFIYIPHHYYLKKHEWNYFVFYLVNNSPDTIKIPCIDHVMNNVSSSVATVSSNESSLKWQSFQKTSEFVECGNSLWTMRLAPKKAIECNIESEYLNLGYVKLYYRIELNLDSVKLISNSIQINLMQKQMAYLK